MPKSKVESIRPADDYSVADHLAIARDRVYQASSIAELLRDVLKPADGIHDGAAQALCDLLGRAWSEIDEALAKADPSAHREAEAA